MARVPELAKFAKAHKLKMVTIKALIEYRMQRETFVGAWPAPGCRRCSANSKPWRSKTNWMASRTLRW